MKNISYILSGAFVVALLIGATYLLMPQTAQAPQDDADAAITSYSLADVQSHNTATNCWTVIDNKVYDLTSYTSQHPGGEKAVLKLCGADGSAAFAKKHGESVRANDALNHLYIGELR